LKTRINNKQTPLFYYEIAINSKFVQANTIEKKQPELANWRSIPNFFSKK
jgi:hypothetical protein